MYKLTKMNIKKLFLSLTSRTYPHGTEELVFPLLDSGLQKDEFGNLFIQIGESDVMFTSHLDTATSTNTKVNHVFEDKYIKTDGTSILGADDKAGVTIMLYMIENNIPGLYYFFLGEEVGCIGSRKVATKHKTEKVEGINKVISFDRRGKDSVITFQSSQRCCSDVFGEALSKELNLANDTFEYKNDPTGILTDSMQFISIYSECTNISVGYEAEHTFGETQDIEHLEKLAEACLKVNWNSLPIERDPSKTDWDYSYGYGYGSYGSYDYELADRKIERDSSKTDWDYSYGFANRTFDKTPKTKRVWFNDNKFKYVSLLEIETLTNKIVKVDFCDKRIEYERVLIYNLLKSLDLFYESFTWDGFNLKVQYKFDHSTWCTRNDIIEYIPELDFSNEEVDSTSYKNNTSYTTNIDYKDYHDEDYYD